eukprot:8285012-Alexandrium_andersonii.AAC.1
MTGWCPAGASPAGPRPHGPDSRRPVRARGWRRPGTFPPSLPYGRRSAGPRLLGLPPGRDG